MVESFSLAFSGGMLQRGFWLYVWRVRVGDRTVFYVGRTGDSSSPNASSPFNRLGSHLSDKLTAKANMLARHLVKLGLQSQACRYDLVAVGRVFAEQDTMESHPPFMNKMAAMESALPAHIRTLGYEVLGVHRTKHTLDDEAFAPVLLKFDTELKQLGFVDN